MEICLLLLYLLLDEAVKSGKIKKGDNVCLVGFGAGLTGFQYS